MESLPPIPVKNSVIWGNTFQDEQDPEVPWQIDDVHDVLVIDFSNVEGGWTGAGSDNIDSNPFFIFRSLGNFQLAWNSPCIDVGDSGELPNDLYDLDEDTNTAEDIPYDRAWEDRVFDLPDQGPASAVVDMGAFERHDGPVSCLGNLVDVQNDYSVNVFDMIALLAAWGPCMDCAADLDDNDVVDVFDLIILLGAWGHCEVNGGGAGELPSEYSECYEQYLIDDDEEALEDCLFNLESLLYDIPEEW